MEEGSRFSASDAYALGCPQISSARASDGQAENGVLSFTPEACLWHADAVQYRKLKEAAYMNTDGASIFSVCALMCAYPLTVVFEELCTGLAIKHLGARVAPAVQFLASVVPLVLVFSVPGNITTSLLTLVALTVPMIALVADPVEWPRLLSRAKACRVARKAAVAVANFTHIDPAGSHLRFVAEYRSMVMMSTCICILAVDFPAAFTRQHAKTEEYGVSLMDLGTGCIICSAAVCSKAARGLTEGRGLLGLLRRVIALWPILAIGFARLAVVSGIDYHVPTSEYGVHWNFFFTIALVSLISTVADLGPRASLVVGSATLLAHELALTYGGLAKYILEAPRVGLFSANRDGILSSIGFLGIHWWSVALGSIIAEGSEAHSTARRLLTVACVCILLVAATPASGLRVSRRMCNLPYALLIIGVNAQVLGTLAYVDLYWPTRRRPISAVLGGVQDSMLATFLVANLMTGAVNVFLQPLLVPCVPALLALIVYSLGWSLPFAMLRASGQRIKFHWQKIGQELCSALALAGSDHNMFLWMQNDGTIKDVFEEDSSQTLEEFFRSERAIALMAGRKVKAETESAAMDTKIDAPTETLALTQLHSFLDCDLRSAEASRDSSPRTRP